MISVRLSQTVWQKTGWVILLVTYPSWKKNRREFYWEQSAWGPTGPGMLTPHLPGSAAEYLWLMPVMAEAADFMHLQAVLLSWVVGVKFRRVLTPLQQAAFGPWPFSRNPRHAARLWETRPQLMAASACGVNTTMLRINAHNSFRVAALAMLGLLLIRSQTLRKRPREKERVVINLIGTRWFGHSPFWSTYREYDLRVLWLNGV